MSEVKWIKITTDMFEDDKIDFIQTLPEADAIIVIWIRLLTLAGKCNAGGYIYLTENIPYDPNMLAFKFRKPVNIVNMALETFKKLGMIESNNIGLFITNWEKHQNVDGLDKIREQTKIRVQKHRENKKLLESNVTCNVTSNTDVTQGNATDIEKDIEIEIEIEKEIEKEIDSIPYQEIINYLNEKADKKYKYTTKATQDKIKSRYKEKFTLEDFKTVINNKVADWKGKFDKDGKSLENYLRPETLFGTKFEGYLNQSNRRNSNEPGRYNNSNTGTGENKYAGIKPAEVIFTGEEDFSDLI